jgi:hypothetical protein
MIKNLNAMQPATSTLEPPGFRDSVRKFIENSRCPDPQPVDINQVMKREDSYI